MSYQQGYGGAPPTQQHQQHQQGQYTQQQQPSPGPPPHLSPHGQQQHRTHSPGGQRSERDPRLRNGSQPPSYGHSPAPSPAARPFPPSSSAGPPSPARHSPAPSYSNQSLHRQEGYSAEKKVLPSQGSSRSLSSQAGAGGGPGAGGPPTIAGEPLHDLSRAVALLKSSKFYAEGFLMKRVEAGPDGKAPNGPEGQWAKWFVQLSGSIMSTWNAAEMEEAARNGSTVPPQYLNLQDAFLHPFPPHARGPKTPTQFQFALNSAGLNRILFCAPTLQSLTMWINAIRLSVWERSRCNEIYTGSLLGLREPRPAGWQGFEAGLPSPGKPPGRFEGWIKARLPGDTEWRRVWVVVQRGSAVPTRSSLVGGSTSPSAQQDDKRNRRSSLLSFGKKNKQEKHEDIVIDDVPGDGAVSTVAFWAHKPTGGKKGSEPPLCIAQHIFYVAAIFPEAEALIENSTLFKLEGTFLNPADGYRGGWGVGGRGEKQGFALLMLEEGGAMDMLHWIVGLADVFKLYGRPRNFSFDPRDPSSLYFALPIGPHRDRQFLDRELVDNLDINESRPRAIRATFHNILFDRMRGIRPAVLNGPPASQGSSTSHSGSAPTSPVDPADQNRRWSQLPPGQNDAPKLPPVLPPIGEGSLVEEQQGAPTAVTTDIPSPKGAARAIEPEGVDARRMSIHRQATADRRNSRYGAPTSPVGNGGAEYSAASTSPPVAAPPANNYLGDIGLRRASQGGSSAEADLSTYTAFLSSDIARERTPPPVSPPQQQRSQFTSPRLDPINTSTSSSQPPVSSGTPVQQHPPAGGFETLQTPATDVSRSEITHLTYAVPGASAQPGFDQHVPHQQSPIYTRPSPEPPLPLPSPGAASALSASGGPAQRAPPSPGLPYLAESPAVTQQGFVNNPTPVSPVQQQPQQFEPAAAPAPLPPAVPVAAPSPQQQGQPPVEEQALRSQTSAHSLGTHVNQPHRGGVVDSPEDLPLESPKDNAFATQPLFGGTGSLSKRSQADVEEPALVEQQQQHEPPRPETPGKNGREEHAEQQETPVVGGKGKEKALSPSENGFDVPEEYNIHQDLLAALDYVDSGSPDIEPATPISPSSVEGTPSTNNHQPFHVGPPKRGMFDRAPSPPASDEHYGDSNQDSSVRTVEVLSDQHTNQSSARTSNSSTPAPPSFPSSFGKNKREERIAAAQLAQQAKEAALTRPGRGAAQPQKKKVWVDSDEDEDEQEEDEEESSDDEPPVRRGMNSASSASLAPSPANNSRGTSPVPMSSSMELPPPVPQQRFGHSPTRSPHVDAAARQSYLENGPTPRSYPGSAPPASPTREVYHTAPIEGQPNRKPALNPHGLLATGMLEKEERSARAQEHAARDIGNTLVSLPAKPPPPQTGLVGALTSHQREKERTGGVGKALTEQARERKLAEQRQKQQDELQRQQLMYQQQMAQQMHFGGGFGGMGMGMGMGTMGFGGSNPWMGAMAMPTMSTMGYGGFPAGGSQIGVPPASPLQPQVTGNGGDQAQQQQAMQQIMMQQQQMMAAQQAAQAAAQQAYLAAMQQFSPPASSPPAGSPSLGPTTSVPPSMPPTMSPSMSFGFGGGFPGVSMAPQMTMAGSPSFVGYGGSGFGHGQQPSMSMYGGFPPQGLGQQQQQEGGQIHTAINTGENSASGERAMSPLDLQDGRRDGTE
ncbi:hypothetical protein JCM8547_007329 [Rhodosporidiobolus lusitaniae]